MEQLYYFRLKECNSYVGSKSKVEQLYLFQCKEWNNYITFTLLIETILLIDDDFEISFIFK